MLILDTDLLTLVQRKSGDVYARLNVRLEAAVAAGEAVAVTIVSVEEQMRGWLAYIARAKTKESKIDAYGRLHELINDFSTRRILEFDAASANNLGRLLKAKIRIGTADLKIAAITLANSATLLSRNLKHFRKVPALRVEDWTLP
jgi:tRNA(fMet)-specific endonuclease VapC